MEPQNDSKVIHSAESFKNHENKKTKSFKKSHKVEAFVRNNHQNHYLDQVFDY
jgi:hypothetical protein